MPGMAMDTRLMVAAIRMAGAIRWESPSAVVATAIFGITITTSIRITDTVSITMIFMAPVIMAAITARHPLVTAFRETASPAGPAAVITAVIMAVGMVVTMVVTMVAITRAATGNRFMPGRERSRQTTRDMM